MDIHGDQECHQNVLWKVIKSLDGVFSLETNISDILESLGHNYLTDMDFVHPKTLKENQESQDHFPSLSIKYNGWLCQVWF